MTDTIDHIYFRQLDGLRCLAILSVMASHFAATSPVVQLFPFGFGVHFFFVLSSFLITRILILDRRAVLERKGSTRRAIFQFYVRRLLRIFPAYYCFLAVMYALNWSPARESIWSLLTFTANFKLAYGANLGMFSHLWSLAVEEQAYILLPLLIFFSGTRNLLLLFSVLTALGVVARTWLFHDNPVYIPYSNFHLLSCLDSFGLGGILAVTYVSKRAALNQLMQRSALIYLSFFSLLAVMLFSYSLPEGPSRYNYASIVAMRFLFNILSCWIIGIAITRGFSGLLRSLLESRVFVYLGKISYGIYLYHLVIPNAVQRVADHLGRTELLERLDAQPLASFLLYGGAAIAVASGSWFILERPFNSLKRFFKYYPMANTRNVPMLSPEPNLHS